VDEGVIVMTELFFPNEDFTKVTLFTNDGSGELVKGDIFNLHLFGAPTSNSLTFISHEK